MNEIYKAVSLLSGGLDSILATKVIMDQGVLVEAINFQIGFGGKENSVATVAANLGIKLHVIDVIDEFKAVEVNPKHGYGAHLNPCLDCKIFMVTKA
ncbi:MAG: 7-cyano-7-deazaguanine synthase, partial [Gammaproteobacteria bacterium]|nr:7-cyano-7-deazaguanine synthase [Gammaproteobacteria bacterium]